VKVVVFPDACILIKILHRAGAANNRRNCFNQNLEIET
jgi:hypothetical protein